MGIIKIMPIGGEKIRNSKTAIRRETCVRSKHRYTSIREDQTVIGLTMTYRLEALNTAKNIFVMMTLILFILA